MKNCLIMLTSSYPFLTQETFLESEFPRICNGFDKVITLAVDLGSNATQKRPTPQKADCYNIASQPKAISRTLSKILGGVYFVKGSDYSDNDMDADNGKRRLFLEYFSARAKREFKLCMKKLEKHDFSQYDSITVYSYWFFVSALIGVKIRDELKPVCKNIKLVSRAHGYDVYENVNVLNYLPLRAYLLEQYDAVFPCSINGEEHLREKYPVFAKKINHSYLGTSDMGLSKPSGDGFHIVSCSALRSLKRVDRIASSLALLKDSGIKNLRWTHIGSGEELGRVKKIAAEKLNFMQVEFKGGISNTEVLNFYKENEIDLFVNVSTTEGLPVSLMEAISFGIPLIATDVGGVKEILKNNYNGILMKENFADSDLAFEIKRFAFAEKEKTEKMRKNARSYWEENFNADNNYSEFLKKII